MMDVIFEAWVILLVFGKPTYWMPPLGGRRIIMPSPCS